MFPSRYLYRYCHESNMPKVFQEPEKFFCDGKKLPAPVTSVVEPEPAGAGLFCWSRSRWKGAGSGLLLCDLGVLRWQSCGNSYNFSQIITIVTQIERTNRYTFRKVQLSSFIFQNWFFFFKFVQNFFFISTLQLRLRKIGTYKVLPQIFFCPWSSITLSRCCCGKAIKLWRAQLWFSPMGMAWRWMGDGSLYPTFSMMSRMTCGISLSFQLLIGLGMLPP